ncbi:MAG: FAD-dependent oxidoreductase [Paracoccaceae bacterium]|nr:FAD-dependent oxidoreductase [Paracoccaceae bacterium]
MPVTPTDETGRLSDRSEAGFPGQARVVIIGGGIMGCGLAYHLTREGWQDIVLLEKAELTSGSTWHAAGQITRSTSSYGLGKCIDYNIRLYSGDLAAETGHAVTWHGCGSLRLAYCQDELDWFDHILSVGRALGVGMERINPGRIFNLHPFYALDGVLGALHTPDDGHVDPAGVTLALAAGARARGARIVRRCRALEVRQQGTGEWTVVTPAGTMICDHVVNAGGTYARQMGADAGILIPATSMTHHYVVTEPVPEFENLDRELPVVRDDRKVSGYVRMEQNAGLIGIYEKANPRSVWEAGCPWDAENELFAPDYDRIMPWLAAAFERMPVLADRGIRRTVHGAISHPPDGNPLIGPAPGVRNYWCCCGTQIGVGWGPGLTRELARWMVHGAADISMREFDPRRFGNYAGPEWQVVKAREDYCLRHEIPFPHFNRPEGRPVRPSPLHDRLKARGAVFEEVSGHERPRWFARGPVPPVDRYSFRRNCIHDIVGDECRAVQHASGLMDITAFAKVLVSGPDAAGFIDRLVPNRLPTGDGRVMVTHFLNRRGRIELEATVARLERNRYYVTAAAFHERRLRDLLAFSRHRGERVAIDNVSDHWAALAINGPRSRDILGATTGARLDNSRFPWLAVREIEVARHPILAMRLSYAGELGWELHGPRRSFPEIYDALTSSGEVRGLTDYGSFAMNAMRMEKRFPGASELTNEVTLPEASAMRFVDPEKPFVGREATLNSQASPLPWVCAYLEIDGDGVTDGHGGEAVVADGRVVGSTTSVAHGHRVDRTLAFAYVKPEALQSANGLEVIVMGSPRPAHRLDAAAYDPGNRLPKTDGAADSLAGASGARDDTIGAPDSQEVLRP